jgi:hypothetical protein
MDFIFMLTRADRTVPDCLDIFAQAGPGLPHVGFKDVGVELSMLRDLRAAIRESGAVCYLEVVATSAEAALQSALMGVELQVDCLLGGTQVAETLEILAGSGVQYFPFPGRPFGHPTSLAGDAAMVEADARAAVAAGCAGVDLLAYRATEAEPLALVRAARRGCGAARLICAGGVDSGARIAALRDAGADAFTVGSAALDGAFVPGGSLADQLRYIARSATGSQLLQISAE